MASEPMLTAPSDLMKRELALEFRVPSIATPEPASVLWMLMLSEMMLPVLEIDTPLPFFSELDGSKAPLTW